MGVGVWAYGRGAWGRMDERELQAELCPTFGQQTTEQASARRWASGVNLRLILTPVGKSLGPLRGTGSKGQNHFLDMRINALLSKIHAHNSKYCLQTVSVSCIFDFKFTAA
jgi:hypothetical protein